MEECLLPFSLSPHFFFPLELWDTLSFKIIVAFKPSINYFKLKGGFCPMTKRRRGVIHVMLFRSTSL